MLNGKGITKEEVEENEGLFKVVQSGETNNGVLGKIDLNYCKRMNYTFTEKPCLTVARSGSAGFVSFQINGCVVGDSAKILLLEDDIATTEHYLFLQTYLIRIALGFQIPVQIVTVFVRIAQSKCHNRLVTQFPLLQICICRSALFCLKLRVKILGR